MKRGADLDGAAGPASTLAVLGGRPGLLLVRIAEGLERAEEELKGAHRACLEGDDEFGHEVAQMVFAVGAVRLSWRKKHGI